MLLEYGKDGGFEVKCIDRGSKIFKRFGVGVYYWRWKWLDPENLWKREIIQR